MELHLYKIIKIIQNGTVKPSTSKKIKENYSNNEAIDEELNKGIITMNDPDFMKFTIMISNLG